MSDSTEHRSDEEQTMYYVWVVLFVMLIFSLQLAIPFGLYCSFYGLPTVAEWITQQVPQYSHAALWNDRVWYPVLKVGPNQPFDKATMVSFDPVSGANSESKFQIPWPMSGFVTDQKGLWCVAPNSVTLIDGEQSTEIKPKRLLNRPGEPFVYDGQIAVVDMSKKSVPVLLVLQNGEWVELGVVAIPFGFPWATVNGKNVLLPGKTSTTTASLLHDLSVIAHHGRLHLFLSDGSIVVYREGLELVSVSALAPANVEEIVYLSRLEDWEMVCTASSRIGIPGTNTFRAGLIDGEPVVVTTLSSGQIPFQGNTLRSFRRVEGVWGKSADQPTPGIMQLLAVTNGQKTYVACQSLAQTLRFHEVTNSAIHPTGAVVRAPVSPVQEPTQRWLRLGQWVYWPSLLILLLGLTALMTTYRDPAYQFGLTYVELASFGRRGFARIIDYFVYVIPNYLLAVASGFASQENIVENMDKMFDMGPGGMLIRFLWVLFSSILLRVSILVISSVFQGYWGVSLGKWICGIRTVRSTLRPCGFLRALLRELFLLADTLMALTWVPATLLIALTNSRQRLGDLVADTIVIRKVKQR